MPKMLKHVVESGKKVTERRIKVDDMVAESGGRPHGMTKKA
jgi:hypothetical protein